MDDLSLALAAQKGDLNAFNTLVLAHQETAYNLACRLLNDPDSAQDITQNAFIAAYRNIKQYRGGSFRAWLLRIVTNACYDELRRYKRHPNLPLEPVTDDPEGEIESPAWMKDDDPLPEEVYEASELDQVIQNCLNGLPEEFRTVVVLVEMEGLDYEEAALSLNKPSGTIKSRLARARLRLRDCLQKSKELLPGKYRLIGEGKL
jgi:RNA polymerase sigma-70 factor (ECF subfamily)